MEDVLLTVFAIIVSFLIFSIPVIFLGAVVYSIIHKRKITITPDSNFLFKNKNSTSHDDRNPLIFDPTYSSLDCNVYHSERRD